MRELEVVCRAGTDFKKTGKQEKDQNAFDCFSLKGTVVQGTILVLRILCTVVVFR